jgi:hypothetical protein
MKHTTTHTISKTDAIVMTDTYLQDGRFKFGKAVLHRAGKAIATRFYREDRRTAVIRELTTIAAGNDIEEIQVFI